MTENRKIPTAEEITSQWGERCPDYEPECACCQMWAMHDALAEANEIAYAKTDKGPMLWKDICMDAFDRIEVLRRCTMRKLEARIRRQRERLRWWESMFSLHVHAHWRKAHPLYFEIVRRDRDALYDKIDGLSSELDSAVQVAYKRGASEWVRLNYPDKFSRLSATE